MYNSYVRTENKKTTHSKEKWKAGESKSRSYLNHSTQVTLGTTLGLGKIFIKSSLLVKLVLFEACN